MRLTDLSIKRLRPPESGQKTYFDDVLPGFGVRISQGGTKSYVVMYGKSRRLKTIGHYPEKKLAEARREAKGFQSTASDEVAPQQPAVDFAEARNRFLKDCAGRNKQRTVADYRRLLNRHFEYTKNVNELTRTDIMSVVRSLADTPSESQHAYVAIRTMMNWCVRHGMIESSPVPSLSHQASPRTRVLSDDELGKVYRRAVEYGYPYGTIVQLLILTGQRRGEIAGLRRNWIQDGEITFPQGFAKNKREHRFPIGALAQEVLSGTPELGEMLFPSRYNDERPFNGWGKAKQAFDSAIEVSGYTLHDLRRTYSSNLARLGVPIHVTEKLLNHVSGTVSGIAAVYNRHTYWDEMCEAVAAHETHLRKLIAD